jgi:chromosome segregation ATPase
MTDREGAYRGGAEPKGLRQRLSSQAEDAIGRLADDLLENTVVNAAVQRALTAREKMAQAQETAMDALNLPSASNLEKLERRLRSVSQRLEQIEEGVDRLDRRIEDVSEASPTPADLARRLDGLDSRLEELGREVAALRREQAREVIPDPQTRAVVPEG